VRVRRFPLEPDDRAARRAACMQLISVDPIFLGASKQYPYDKIPSMMHVAENKKKCTQNAVLVLPEQCTATV
jgi:hypothetical protein